MFQKTIISKYLKTQDDKHLTEKWDLFCEHFQNLQIQENIRISKEEQYQEGFFRDFFVKILGYTLNPTIGFNLTTEYKNIKDSKKADGAIIIEEKVVGVIELKGTNTTDLGKVEEQAFNYKNNQKGCAYVITSNFEKLRLYIEDSVTFTEFNLFTLKRDDFNLLYLLLSFENIKNNIPKKLKDESLNQEDIVTKKLYKDYSVFKQELFQNLTLLNPEYDPLKLFQKSQKLLDRLLFLFFGEDRGLLPPNSVRQVLDQWNKLKDLDAYDPLYNRYKKYFGYLNTGFKGKNHDVFAYNGGLFKDDEILDNIKIDDELLYNHTFKLSQYDFASEVDVNILGHIFENSLNEIDEIKSQLEGTEIDKSKTKRKKDGVFYTPKYITKYIVENTVGKLCEEKKTEFEIVEEEYSTDKKRQQKTKENLLSRLDIYRKWLLQITIVDPACGSGAFLNEALNFLITEHEYVDELEAKLLNVPIIFSYHSESILEHNLFGVDLNEESVKIAKLSLWLRTAEPNRKLNSLNDNIKCGNSLIDDPEIAGEKAFNWETEFPQVFEKGGFDVVIGNPPYVRRTQLNGGVKIGLEKNFYSAFKQYDLYVLFNELALIITKPNGLIGFIQPNKFLSAEYGFKILNLLVNNSKILNIYDVSLDNVFIEASVYPYVFIFEKLGCQMNFEDKEINLFDYCENENLKGFDKVIRAKSIIEKLENSSVKINELTNSIKRGVPNSKIKFTESMGKLGIKSTLLEFPYFLPKPEIYIEYLDKKDLEIKEKEFSNKLILLPRTTLKIRAILKQSNEHVLDRIYYFQINNENYIFEYILALLNSKITTYYYDYIYGSTKIGGGYIDLKGSQIENFLIPKANKVNQIKFQNKSNLMLSFYQRFQEISSKFQRLCERKFEGINLTKKLQNWYELSYTDFIKELTKQKIILTLSEESDWETYFEEEKTKALEIQSQITTTDQEIDRMVYELYGLTEEEIGIVEKC